MCEDIKIFDINTKKYNPFGASAEELLANAMDDSGLLKSSTTINDKSAIALCRVFNHKRENYKELTKLGNLLITNNVISSDELKEALTYQMENPDLQIGNILLNLDLCSMQDIDKCLNAQVKLREEIKN